MKILGRHVRLRPPRRICVFFLESRFHPLASWPARYRFLDRRVHNLMVMVAWAINIVEKQLATYFGGAVTFIGMLTAVGVRRAWFVDILVRIPYIQRLQARAYRASEDLVEDELKGLMTLAEAVEVKPFYSSSTLLALRDRKPAPDTRRRSPVSKAKEKRRCTVSTSKNGRGCSPATTPHAPNEQGVKLSRRYSRRYAKKASKLFRSGRYRTMPRKRSPTPQKR